jgi:hypothetical protein
MPDLGDVIPLTVQVKDQDAQPTDALTVSLTITEPDGTTVSPVVVNPPAVTGLYEYDYMPTQIGRHLIRWVSTTPNAAFTDTIDVRDLSARSIMSLASAKTHLNMTSSKDDEEIRNMIEAVTAVIERHRGEAVVRQEVVEDNVMGDRNRFALMKHPVIEVTEILNYLGIPQDVTKWKLDKQNGILTNYAGAGLTGDVTISYVAGYTEIPANYILAAKIILGHLWTTQRIQNIGQQVSLGTRARPEEQVMTPTGVGYAIPARAVELLGGRPSVVV